MFPWYSWADRCDLCNNWKWRKSWFAESKKQRDSERSRTGEVGMVSRAVIAPLLS